MGNRAVLSFSTNPASPAIYLHWNGGRASVEAFLAAARALGLRSARHLGHAETMDRLAQLISVNFFGNSIKGGRSVTRCACGTEGDHNEDNGLYVLSDDLQVIDRRGNNNREEINPTKTADILAALLERAPAFND